METRNCKKRETQSAEYDVFTDPTYDRDALGFLPRATSQSVMHHILHALLKEKRTIGPIRSALKNGGFNEPHELALMDPFKLLTNRTIDGKYLKVPVLLSQHAQLSLENFKSFIIFKMMKFLRFSNESWACCTRRTGTFRYFPSTVLLVSKLKGSMRANSCGSLKPPFSSALLIGPMVLFSFNKACTM